MYLMLLKNRLSRPSIKSISSGRRFGATICETCVFQILTATPATIVSASDSSEDTEDGSLEQPVKEPPPPRFPFYAPPFRPKSIQTDCVLYCQNIFLNFIFES
jgi:hypothetical protein